VGESENKANSAEFKLSLAILEIVIKRVVFLNFIFWRCERDRAVKLNRVVKWTG
jgi:hypothetical protein